MLHSISSSHFPTHRNCKRNACRLSLIACNLSHKNCTHKCVCQCVCVLLKIIYCRIMHIFITLELHKFRHYCTLRPAAAPSSSHSSSSLLLLCLAAHRQVIVASSRWLQQSHTQTHTDRQADRQTDRETGRPTVYMHMWLISRRLRFLHALAVTAPDGEGAAWLGRAGAALKCRTCLVSKISVIHSVLPASPTWSARLLLWNLDFYGPNGSKCWKLALQLDSCHLPSIRNAHSALFAL